MPAGGEETAPRRWSPVAWLYALAVAAHALPLWLVDRVVTMDGPSHVYNGWVLSRLWTERYPWLERVFAVRWEPVPNWTSELLLALGTVAHGSVLAALKQRRAAFSFAHGARHHLDNGILLADSYHCSRYNTNTGRLTTEMFEAVIGAIRQHLDAT